MTAPARMRPDQIEESNEYIRQRFELTEAQRISLVQKVLSGVPKVYEEKGWTKGFYLRAGNGHPIEHAYPDPRGLETDRVCSCCLVGAMMVSVNQASLPQSAFRAAFFAAEAHIWIDIKNSNNEDYNLDTTAWNDNLPRATAKQEINNLVQTSLKRLNESQQSKEPQ